MDIHAIKSDVLDYDEAQKFVSIAPQKEGELIFHFLPSNLVENALPPQTVEIWFVHSKPKLFGGWINYVVRKKAIAPNQEQS